MAWWDKVSNKFSSAINSVKDLFKPKMIVIEPGSRQRDSIKRGFVSPVSFEPTPTLTPTLTPTPSPSSRQPRHPGWQEHQRDYPKYNQELTSGTRLASQKYNVPQNMLMDISMIETGGKPIDQYGGGPGQGYFQFEPKQSFIPPGFDPYSATASADLAAREISNRRLSRWGLPGGSWGSLDASRRLPKDRLTTYYSANELNPYLPFSYQLK